MKILNLKLNSDMTVSNQLFNQLICSRIEIDNFDFEFEFEFLNSCLFAYMGRHVFFCKRRAVMIVSGHQTIVCSF